MKNPFTALILAKLFKYSINSFEGIVNSLNIPYILKVQGVDFGVIDSDDAILNYMSKRKVEQYHFDTIWFLNLGGLITSYEGAKSILEYRKYMRNPLTQTSILIPIGKQEIINKKSKLVTYINDEFNILDKLDLTYGEVHYLELNQSNRLVLAINPVPEISIDKVDDVCKAISEKVKELLK